MVYIVLKINPVSLEGQIVGIFNSIGCARDQIIIEYFRFTEVGLGEVYHQQLMRHNKLTFGKFYYEISEEILQP